VGALAVGMSGSGPTVFGVFPDVRKARAALERAVFEAPLWARVALAAEAG
jgi:4-diphosphocytidyl-2C-methyl-D-erythritol kinase